MFELAEEKDGDGVAAGNAVGEGVGVAVGAMKFGGGIEDGDVEELNRYVLRKLRQQLLFQR